MRDESREGIVAAYVRAWQPDLKRPHCNHCMGARVHGDPEGPTTYCASGHGKAQPLTRLIRPRVPHGFRAAVDCPDWDAAGEGWE